MIHIHLYTYAGDALLTPATVRVLLQTTAQAGWQQGRDYQIYVIDDGIQPCPDEIRTECMELGARWEPSWYMRGGNLRGHACITGILSGMLASLDADPDEDAIALKMDVDTLVLGLDWLRHIRDTPSAMISAADDRGSGYGMCYALRRPAIERVLASLDQCPVGTMHPEDQVICYRARLLCGSSAWQPIPMRLPGQLPGSPNGPHGIVAPYQWDDPAHPMPTGDIQILNMRASARWIPAEQIAAAARKFITD